MLASFLLTPLILTPLTLLLFKGILIITFIKLDIKWNNRFKIANIPFLRFLILILNFTSALMFKDINVIKFIKGFKDFYKEYLIVDLKAKVFKYYNSFNYKII
jgi:hypothetical protein